LLPIPESQYPGSTLFYAPTPTWFEATVLAGAADVLIGKMEMRFGQSSAFGGAELIFDELMVKL